MKTASASKDHAAVGLTPLKVIDISYDDSHYVHTIAGMEVPCSDFLMEPTAVIKVNGDEAQTIFVVRVDAFGHAGPEEHQVPASIFHATMSFKKWCEIRRFSWTGGHPSGRQDRLDALFNRLNMAVVPELIGVTVTGLHDNAFVQEASVFGRDADKYAYVKPVTGLARASDVRARGTDVGWTLIVDEQVGIELPDDMIALAVPEWRHGLEALGTLHLAEVMTPLLGWMAACPLRSMHRMFPPLAVMGGAGWGKSTIIRTVMDSFGYGTEAIGLNGTTPYAIYSAVSSTNALPVWVDEYRLGVRRDAKDAINQALRDAWESGYTLRGGTTENLSKVMAVRISAPIVVSGEDTFSETSHVQRILLINMPKDGKNPEALAHIEGEGEYFHHTITALQEFFSLYIEWLLVLKAADLLPRLPNVYDRQAHGRAVARWGYDLLCQFAASMGCDGVLPAWDESRVLAGVAEHVDLYEELIEDAVGTYEPDGIGRIVWDQDGFRNIRPGAFVQWVQTHRTEDLAGGRKAVTNYVVEKFGAQKHDYGAGRCRKCWRWILPESVTNEAPVNQSDTSELSSL
jgi:hypothetical protein